VTLLAFAAERRAVPTLSINISLPPGPQQQTRRTLRAAAAKDGTD